MNRVLVLALLFAGLSRVATVSQPLHHLYWSRNGSGNGTIVMPLRLVDERPFIEVQINGKGPFRFLLDSGGVALLNADLIKTLGLPVLDTVEGTGAGEQRVIGYSTSIREFRIGNIVLNDVSCNATSFADARHVFGAEEYDGVIGLPLFSRFVVALDYEKKTVAFTAPGRFDYRGSGYIVKFEPLRQLPLILASIDGIEGRFGVDTGAAGSVLLTSSFIDENHLRSKYNPKIEAISGWGIGGAIRSQIARSNSFKIGPLELHNLVTRLSLQKSGSLAASPYSGLLGGRLLSRFRLIFDYQGRRIIFEPNRAFGDRDSYDRAGMWLSVAADARNWEVTDVLASGPAYRAGLRIGDQVQKIDGKSVAVLSLPAIRRRLRTASPGKKISVEVIAEGRVRTVVVQLEELV